MNRPSATERDYTACLSVGFVTLKDPPKQPVAKVMQERKNGDCHQFAPRHGPRNKALSLKRIGWLSDTVHLLSLANCRDMTHVQIVGARHAVPVFQGHCILRASISCDGTNESFPALHRLSCTGATCRASVLALGSSRAAS